jgi:hypothetical protein
MAVHWNVNTFQFVNFFSTCSKKAVHVGRQPSLSVMPYNGSIFVLQVHTDSFCYYTEEHNKDPFIKLCDHQPKSSTNIMTYTFAEWDALTAHFKAAKNDSYITVCHPSIMHGTYDMGQNPSVALFVMNDQLGVVEMHNGALREDFKDHSGCGTSVLYDHPTIILDSWNLTQFLNVSA